MRRLGVQRRHWRTTPERSGRGVDSLTETERGIAELVCQGLTNRQIADALMNKLDPRGVIVVVEAEHLCMAMRGVRKPGAVTTTSAVRGQFKTSAASRAEALDLILHK